MDKTYKRETAAVMLVFLSSFFVWGVWEPMAMEVAKYLTTPIFLFVTAAFSMDAYSKQMK